jgi:GNAT superfamily N-acetyltransferase
MSNTRPVGPAEDVRVRAFTADDEPRVLQVLQAAFGRWPHAMEAVAPGEFFRWKHASCPFGSSMLLVAEHGGEVVGFIGYLPWRFRACGRIVKATRGVDLAVHPDYRRRGVSVAIRALPEFPDEVALTWSNPNQPSRAGSRTTGRRYVGTVPRFVRACRPLHSTIGRAVAKRSGTPRPLRIEAAPAAELLRDGDYVASLLASAHDPSDRLTTAKDVEYLRWRYGRFDEYRAVAADGGRGRGLAIVRPRRYGQSWALDVCELLVEGDDRRAARHLLREVGDAARADFMLCGFPTAHRAAMLGFVNAPGGMTLMTYALHQNLVPDPTRRSSWALSRGDVELL